MWYALTIGDSSHTNEQSADVHIPAESPWFCGHFPGNPILPGIAQLYMIFDLIQRSLNKHLTLTEVSRIRFKQMIMPDDRLTVSASPRPGREGSYAFRIIKQDELICNGVITVAEASGATHTLETG